MRITAEEKARNRAAIIATAGRLFRERGLANVGIADLMREAGFTHGGFYNHFDSKEALVAEVCGASSVFPALAAGLAGPDADGAWRTFVEGYLSIAHRDGPGDGCSHAALLGEAAHESEEIQSSLACASGHVIDLFAGYFRRRYRLDEEASRTRAIDTWTQMVGAVSFSRGIVRADRALADEVLAVCRARLLR